MKNFDNNCSFTFFSYFATFSVIIPLTGLFLSLNGFSNQEIGTILGLSILTRIFGPLVFSILVKRVNNLVVVFRLQCLLFFASVSLGFLVDSKMMIIIALCFMNAFWISILPNIETISLSGLKGDMKRYSVIRMWGSIGFIIMSLFASQVMINFGSNFYWLFLSVLGVMLFLSSLRLEKSMFALTNKESGSIIKIERGLVLYYLIFFMFEMTHAPYYGFFTIKLLEGDYSGLTISVLIAFAVICEIVTFSKGHKFLEHISVNNILIMCSIFGVCRWVLVEFYMNNIYLLILSQVLHAFTFALYHICAMNILSANASQTLISQRQTTYTALTMGIGAALGAYLAGALWETNVIKVSSFITVGVGTMLLAILLTMILKFKKNKNIDLFEKAS